MKTPQEKAKELVFIMVDTIPDNVEVNVADMPLWKEAFKQCALRAVDEIIRLHKGKFMCEREEQNEEYWQQVKQEIEKL